MHTGGGTPLAAIAPSANRSAWGSGNCSYMIPYVTPMEYHINAANTVKYVKYVMMLSDANGELNYLCIVR
jgi:hypothetical protein